MEKKATSPQKVPNVEASKIIGHVYASYEITVTSKDLILYALSLGFNQDPKRRDEYKFTYEFDKNFTSFPTIPVVIAHKNFSSFLRTPGLPKINPIMILHGSEEVEIIKPIKADTKYKVIEKALDIQDKGKFSVLVGEAIITNPADEKDVSARIIS